MENKHLILMMGISGCGKSCVARKFTEIFRDSIIISRDAIRFSLLSDEDSYFKKEKQVFKNYVTLAQTAIECQINKIYLDATHLNRKSRDKILRPLAPLLHSYGYDVDIIYVHTPIETAIERDAKRTGRMCVGEKVIREQFTSLELPTEEEVEYWKPYFDLYLPEDEVSE